MANTYSQRFFGITTDVSGVTSGIIANSLSFSDTVSTAQAKGTKGEVLNIAAYSKESKLDIQGVFLRNRDPGWIGDHAFRKKLARHGYQ